MCLSLCGVVETDIQIITQNFEDYYLRELPSNFDPYEKFKEEFQSGDTSTEKLNEDTNRLSQIMHKNIPEGLEQLLSVDESVIESLKNFIPQIESVGPSIAERLGKNGRIFLIGAGSNGRAAIDIAAKCKEAFSEAADQIQGLIAGGDSAFIRAQKNFENTEQAGINALQNYHLGPNDTVILISAVGSASFNIGCGLFSAEKGAYVLYFCNKTVTHHRAEQLFKRTNNPVIPLFAEIPAQAFAGSARLHGALFAEILIGSLLVNALYLNKKEGTLAKQYLHELVIEMQISFALLKSYSSTIEQFILQEKTIFSNFSSCFRQSRDWSDHGYVTFIAAKNSIREVLINSTETSRIFSTNPIHRESESGQKRAEFRAYLMGKESNHEAWKALLGREISPGDVNDTEAFLLSCNAPGIHSYHKRPIGKGNFLIGVAKLKEDEQFSDEILHLIEKSRQSEGKTGFIFVCRGKLSESQVKQLNNSEGTLYLAIENVPYDSIGFIEAMILKLTLNLISTSSMILMNKVHGNRMIDINASNKKLTDCCMRLIKEIWYREMPLTDKELYHYIAHVSALKDFYEEKSTYTPSLVKIILTMLSLQKTPSHFQEVIDCLAEQKERIDWILR